MCEHKFVFGGVKYEDGHYPLPGSGARSRQYFDFYFCEKCLEKKYEKLPFEDNTYSKVQFSASPKAG
jgi:hypothetical protein